LRRGEEDVEKQGRVGEYQQGAGGQKAAQRLQTNLYKEVSHGSGGLWRHADHNRERGQVKGERKKEKITYMNQIETVTSQQCGPIISCRTLGLNGRDSEEEETKDHGWHQKCRKVWG